MRKTIQSAVAAIAVGLSSGCNGTDHDIEDLSPENQELVDRTVKDAIAVEGVVIRLVRAAGPLFDASGIEGNNDQLVEDIKDNTKTLEYFHEAGKIFQYDSRLESPKSQEETEAVAFMHSEKLKPGTLDDNYIALDVADRLSWTTGVLAHEAGHVLGGHSKAISEAADMDRLDSPEFIKLTLAERDFSYLLSDALYFIPDRALSQLRLESLGGAGYLMDEYHAGNLTAEQVKEMLDSYMNEHGDEWTADVAEEIYRQYGETLAPLDIDAVDILESLLDDGFQERLAEIDQEVRQEVNRELKTESDEAKAEIVAKREGELRMPAKPYHFH